MAGSEATYAPFDEHDLRRAIDGEELSVRYQPIVDATSMQLVCVEALVRWEHPLLGTIMPDAFIQFAEEHGLIGDLGAWVLQTACKEALRWPGLRLAVNMSVLQLQDPAFVRRVKDILARTGFPAQRLELELTETAVMRNVVAAQKGLTALRAAGVRVALDDFGAGHSSLISLRRLSLDKIKIDKEFLDALGESGDADIIIRGMVRLGRDLGMTVTAEGVEAQNHQAFLAEIGCHELQGYLFSRPVVASEIDVIFKRQLSLGPVAGAA